MPSPTEQKISVVIPTWRRGDLLQNCLESLRGQTCTDFETVLVSNGAGEWADRLAEAFDCTLVKLPVNRGVAAAVNAGIAASRSDYVLVLNDDVELDSHWLERTVAFLDEHPDAAFCCGKIYQADGVSLDDAGDALSLGGSAWRVGYGRKDTGEFDLPRPVWAVSGTATLFRRSVFEKVGLLDEDFFAYLEDMDFSLRAARAGFSGFYLPQATSRHRGSATLGGPDAATIIRLLTQNQLLLLTKHFPGSVLVRLAPRIAWAQILWALLAIRKRRLRAYLGGVAGYLRLLPRTLRRRGPFRSDERQAFLARLRKSEWEIYADVRAPDRTERDTFWKLYFGLFPARRDAGDPATADLRHPPANEPHQPMESREQKSLPYPEGNHPPQGLNISVIIVTYNSSEHIVRCLDSLRGTGAEVVIVDNASSDGTADLIRERFPSVNLIRSASNLGFAGAANLGVRHSSGSSLLFLNPDTVCLDPLGPLGEALESSEHVAAVAPRLVGANGRTQIGFTVRRLPTPAALIFEILLLNRIFPNNPVNRRNRCLDFDYSQPAEVEQPAGAALLVRRANFEACGGFDERFFPLWFEDVDLCKRLREGGGSIRFLPGVRVEHRGAHSVDSLTFSQKQIYWYRNLLYYVQKHFPWRFRAVIRGALLVGMGSRIVAELLGVPANSQASTSPRRERVRAYWNAAKLSFVGVEDVLGGE